MTNKQVARTLEEIATLLDLAGENPFKSRTYVNMARTIEGLDEDITVLVREERLREIKGLGQALEQKITELVTTGSLDYLDELRAQFPPTLFELFQIPGLGAKRIKGIHDELGVSSLAELETACQEGKVAALKGFGQKTEAKILEGIAFVRQHQGQFLMHTAEREASAILKELQDRPETERAALAGSIRRRKDVVKDIDLIASSSSPVELMERFITSNHAARVTNHGETKSSIVTHSGIATDLRVVSPSEFPFAILHFTGSKEHNVVLRQRAKDRGLKLNEYGLFKDDECLPCKTEKDIYKALGLPFIPPELREDRGEFDAVKLPALVEPKDLLGVVHCHSSYSDGANTIEDMAGAAKALGYQYLGMADHSQSAAYAGGLVPETVLKQFAEIDALNKRINDFRILKGIESDIRGNGDLDYDEDLLEQFDYIVASVHSKLDMTQDEATARVLKAIENPYTTILGHPTGRLLLRREGYSLDWEQIFDACLNNRVALEINANPNRLDLDWRLIKRAKDKGCVFCIGPDAHGIDEFSAVHFGVAMARKGWLERENLLNCLDVEAFLAWKRGE